MPFGKAPAGKVRVAVIFRVWFAVVLHPAASVAVKPKFTIPAVVGVPVIRPVED